MQQGSVERQWNVLNYKITPHSKERRSKLYAEFPQAAQGQFNVHEEEERRSRRQVGRVGDCSPYLVESYVAGQSRAPHGSALPLVFHNTQDRSSRRVLPRAAAAYNRCCRAMQLLQLTLCLAAQPVLIGRNNIDRHLIEIRQGFQSCRSISRLLMRVDSLSENSWPPCQCRRDRWSCESRGMSSAAQYLLHFTIVIDTFYHSTSRLLLPFTQHLLLNSCTCSPFS